MEKQRTKTARYFNFLSLFSIFIIISMLLFYISVRTSATDCLQRGIQSRSYPTLYIPSGHRPYFPLLISEFPSYFGYVSIHHIFKNNNDSC